MRYLCLLVFVGFCCLGHATEITLDHQGVTLNADLEGSWPVAEPEPVIILVHGTLAHKDMEIIQTLQDLFSEYEKTSLAINLSLGVNNRVGMYPCELAHTHRNEHAIEEIDVWVRWLKSQGVHHIVLLGHSRGGNQVARYVRDHANRVLATVLIAPSTAHSPPSGDDSDSSPLTKQLVEARETDWLQDIDFLHCQHTRVASTTFLSYYDDPDQHTPNVLGDLALPTLILSGSEDIMVPNLPAALSETTNPHVQHVSIEGAGHFFRDLYADEVVEAVIEFVKAAR